MVAWGRKLGVFGRAVAKWVAVLVAVLLLVAVTAVGLLYTDWGRDELRVFLVGQANKYLSATLEIGALEGSLFSGVDLRDVRLSREGRTLVRIDAVSLAYDSRLFQGGTVIREIRLTRPYVLAQKEDDGRWNLTALVRRDGRDNQQPGAPRPIHIESLQVTGGVVELASPVTFGAVHVPTRFNDIDVSLSFDRSPAGWRLSMEHASAVGGAPDLTMNRISGAVSGDPDGLLFESFSVETAQSAFTLDGRINRGGATSLDLSVSAERFKFQEWAGIVGGLRNIAVDAAFKAELSGPLDKLAVDLDLSSTAGSLDGTLVLNTRVPGWHAAGALQIARLDLADWLSRQDDRSDISGDIEFDLDLDLGRRFPRGSYSFRGSHVAFAGYEADDLRTHGSITASDVLIKETVATAYGARVGLTDGSIGIDRPFPFRFEGHAADVDLRRVPERVPVPHVESTLAFDYEIRGQFSSPFVAGNVVFADSTFLGAAIAPGAVGMLDTSVRPLTYGGEGDLSGVDLQRFASDLELAWLQDPRYTGAISGHFRVNGAGSNLDSLLLTAGGRLTRGILFDGVFSDADVTLEIHDGSLEASYDGRFEGVDPSIALADERFGASLNGSAMVRLAVRDLLVRQPALGDYVVSGDVALTSSTVREIDLDAAAVTATLSDGTLDVTQIRADGPAISAEGFGTVELDGSRSSQFDYTVARADLSLAREFAGRDVAGRLQTKGRVTGPTGALRFTGDATIADFLIDDVEVLSATGTYDATGPADDPAEMMGNTTIRASSIKAFGRRILEAEGQVSYESQRLALDLQVTPRENLVGRIAGTVIVHAGERAIDVTDLDMTLDRMAWRLVTTDPPPIVAWSEAGIDIGPMAFVDAASGAQRLGVSGTWRYDGSGALRLTGNGVFVDALAFEREGPAPYGGVLDFDATVAGTRQQPIVTGRMSITDGRVRRLSYERLEGRVEYFNRQFEINLRLDQAPGVWLTAAGSVPLGLFDPDQPDQPMYLAIASTPIQLGLIEGVTDVVRDVTGQARLDITVAGSSRKPDFIGSVEIDGAGFLVSATGTRYDKGRALVALSTERITVASLQLEDRRGRLLEVRGSLGTRELRLQELELEVSAKGFEILRNEFGTADVDMQVNVLGRLESPRLTGTLTVVGGEVFVDQILDRTLFRPYATEAQTTIEDPDAVVTTRAWDRMGLDMAVRVPGSLRMTGDDVQVRPGTPLGLGDINLRATGDLYLYKDPGQPLYITGSLDQITGAYAFQGRRFDLDPSSSVNFRGDLTPDLYVTVRRVISGVETTVSLIGPLSDLELRLASSPPLDPSDVLSLIVFDTPTNGLSGAQQEQLAVRAGTLAAAFLANPLVSTLERTLGLETLAIEPGTGTSAGARVTIGDEIAPGLVARFSRQFGQEQYDEASLEYYLSRILRLRATFSDAAGLIANSPFRRVERAGVDLLVFLSF